MSTEETTLVRGEFGRNISSRVQISRLDTSNFDRSPTPRANFAHGSCDPNWFLRLRVGPWEPTPPYLALPTPWSNKQI